MAVAWGSAPDGRCRLRWAGLWSAASHRGKKTTLRLRLRRRCRRRPRQNRAAQEAGSCCRAAGWAAAWTPRAARAWPRLAPAGAAPRAARSRRAAVPAPAELADSAANSRSWAAGAWASPAAGAEREDARLPGAGTDAAGAERGARAQPGRRTGAEPQAARAASPRRGDSQVAGQRHRRLRQCRAQRTPGRRRRQLAGPGRHGHSRALGPGTTGPEATGTGNRNMPTSAGPGGPLAGIGGAGPNAAAAAARARFGPSPFDDPSFEIPAFSPSASDGSPFDDRAFGAPGPGTPAPAPRHRMSRLWAGPALGRARPGRASTGWASTGQASTGGPARGATPPGVPADADRPGPTAGNGGSRGSGRHGAGRGSSGGNSPVSGGADADGPSLGRAGDAPAQPMRTLGSAHRLNAVRGPQTSGHPPWEPAEKPVSELPWMDAPGSGQSRMVPPRRVFPVGAEGPADRLPAAWVLAAWVRRPGAGGTGLAGPGSRPADRPHDRRRAAGAGPPTPARP